MKRLVIVYRNASQGYGCIQDKLEVTDENFVSETPTTITVKEQMLDQWECEYIGEMTYFTDINAFIQSEDEWFAIHIKELTERHQHTLKMAREFTKA